MFQKSNLRHTIFIAGSLGILLSCFLNWVGIISRRYTLFEFSAFAATWGRYDNLWWLHILAVAYFLIPIFACFVLMTLSFRKTSRIIAFIGGIYCILLSGVLLLPSLLNRFGVPNFFKCPGLYIAFISACILLIGAICSRKQYEIVHEAEIFN